MRSEEEICAELVALQGVLPRVREYTAFGESNRAAIEAQIEVLEKRLTRDDVYDRYGSEDDDEFSQYVLDSAVDAVQWRRGEVPEAPSSSWQSLVPR